MNAMHSLLSIECINAKRISYVAEQEALLRIKQLFDAEWCSPTDEPEALL